jgi:hypothetical protein
LEESTLSNLKKFLKKRSCQQIVKEAAPLSGTGGWRTEMLSDRSLSFTARLLIPDNKIHCSILPSRDIRGIGHAV